MRARFHIRAGRAGFYREGTHQLCDAAATGQLLPDAADLVGRVAEALESAAPGAATELSIAENVAGDERALHAAVAGPSGGFPQILDAIVRDTGVAGFSALTSTGVAILSGAASVSDPVALLVSSGAPHRLRRSAASFFQGNRYLLSDLVHAVLELVADDGEVVDLYAGVGLFSVALAARGHLEVTAVESDRATGADLVENARPFAPRITARLGRVEDYLRSRRGALAAAIVDPPRTGVSKEAMQALLAAASAAACLCVVRSSRRSPATAGACSMRATR